MMKEATMETLLGGYALGDPLVQGALQVFPLRRKGSPPLGERPWELADKLLSEEQAEVREVDEGGTVNTLSFENRSGKHALLFDGIELSGCKQNRMINTTLLAAAGTTTSIPVSCVEAGRWNYRSRTFSHSGRMVTGALRNRKAHMVKESLMGFGEARSDQSEVWAEVGRTLGRTGRPSPTSALDAAYEPIEGGVDDGSFPEFEAEGAIVVIGENVIGMDLLADGETFATFWNNALRGYRVDALGAGDAPNLDGAQVRSWFDGLAARASLRPVELPGAGEHYVIDGEDLSGTIVLHEGELVHAALFPQIA